MDVSLEKQQILMNICISNRLIYFKVKHLLLAAVFIGFSFESVSQGINPPEVRKKADSLTSVKVKGKMLVLNAGFAPISAFSFDDPLAIGFLSLVQKRFRYEPDFALGLDGTPWMNNNWFRYDFYSNKISTLNVGVNPFLFFKKQKVNSGEEMIQVQRSLVFEVGCLHRLSDRWSLNVTYEYNKGFDQGSLSGHFLSVVGLLDKVVAELVSISVKSQLFYFDFDGDIDGFFTSASLNIKHKKLPVACYTQAALPLWTNFPDNCFKWNAGLVYDY
jgi:hypothetical protein